MNLEDIQDKFNDTNLSEEEIRDLVSDQIDTLLDDDNTVPEIQERIGELNREFRDLVKDVMSKMS